MLLGNRAERFEQSQKPENFFRIDLSNSRDFFHSESLAQHFQSHFSDWSQGWMAWILELSLKCLTG